MHSYEPCIEWESTLISPIQEIQLIEMHAFSLLIYMTKCIETGNSNVLLIDVLHLSRGLMEVTELPLTSRSHVVLCSACPGFLISEKTS